MLELEQAQERILFLIPLLDVETVPLWSAAGRILAESVAASRDLPPFDNSAMDGYAVRAEDVASATSERPVTLTLRGRVTAGEVSSHQIGPGECVRVFTGSTLPGGADAVVMQEDTRTDPLEPHRVWVNDSAKPWENVRFRGDDVKSGVTVLDDGERLSAASLAILSALGCDRVHVRRRPRLGLIATGSELREPGETLLPGQIFESNRVTMAALASQAGAEPKVYPLVPDDLPRTQALLRQALEECDAVVTSGGVSVGELDFVKAAFEAIGGALDFWKVAIKPGKPFVLGRRSEKLLFGLPGNPVSAFVTFLLLVRPALLRFQGARTVWLPVRTGVLEEDVANPGDRRHFVRASINNLGRVRTSGRQSSHYLHSLARANGLLDVLPRTTMRAGNTVSVQVWE
jgi:molybdopterin molybdotransferase